MLTQSRRLVASPAAMHRWARHFSAVPAPWPATTTDIRSDAWAAPGVAVDNVGITGGGKRVLLSARPVGDFKDDDFQIVEAPVPEAGEGEAVVRNILVSIDPTHRIWATECDQYMPAVGLGTVMRAFCIGQVVKTSDPDNLAVGAYVSGLGGVQEYFASPIAGLNPVAPGVPLSYNHSLFSALSGLTAWVGTNICEPKAGQTMVVSGAAGAVGSIAAQIAKSRGAKVVGIAGSAEKCSWLVNDCGLDAAINYKTESIAERLSSICPEGIDSYFDNVGGSTLETALKQMNNFSRIAFCGSISGYNESTGEQSMTVKNYDMILMRRIKVQGFITVDHVADVGACMEELGTLFQAGNIKVNEDIQEAGIEEYPRVVRKLYDGSNTGKLMMKISHE